MPPNAPLEADTCPALLEELYPQIWLGSWLERVDAREVIFNNEAADACMTTLRSASCGEELRAALFDPTCFLKYSAQQVERSNVAFFPGYRDSTKHVPRSGMDSADYISAPATLTEASAASLRMNWMAAAHRSRYPENRHLQTNRITRRILQ